MLQRYEIKCLPQNDFNTANFGNDINYNFQDTYLGLEYKFKLHKVIFKPALYFHNYQWNNQTTGSEKINFSKNMVLPKFTLKVDFKNSEKLNFKYRLNARFPTVNSLVSNYILSSFNRVFKGNNQLENSKYHSLSLHYYKFNLYRGYNISLSTNYNKKTQSSKSVTELNGINQYSTQIMFYEPEINWSLNGSFSKTINKVKSKLRTNYRYNDYYQLLNNNTSQNKSNTFSVEPSIKTLFKKLPNLEIGYRKSFTNYKNNTITKFTNDRLFAILDYDYKNFIFETDFEYNNYQNKTDNSVNNSFVEANASVFYQQEDSAWGFELNARNLFDAKFKQNNSQSDFIISDSQTFILPRVVMFKVIYKL